MRSTAFRRLVAGREGGGVCARRRHEPVREAWPAAVDHVVGDHGGDDLAPEPMAAHRLGVFAHGPGEVVLQKALEIGVVDGLDRHDLALQLQLAVGQQDRQLRPGQALAGLGPFGDPGGVGQALHHAVETAGGFQLGHELGRGAKLARRVHLHQRQGQGLVVVVGQHVVGDLVGHGLQQGVAALARELAGALQHAGEDLDVHLVVGGVDARGIVDRVGVDPTAGERVFDTPGLRQAEVRALAHDLDPQVAAVDPQRIVALSPTSALASRWAFT